MVRLFPALELVRVTEMLGLVRMRKACVVAENRLRLPRSAQRRATKL